MVPLENLTREKVEVLVQAWYVEDVAMTKKLLMIAATKRIIMKKGVEWGYYTEPDKALFICKDSLSLGRATAVLSSPFCSKN